VASGKGKKKGKRLGGPLACVLPSKRNVETLEAPLHGFVLKKTELVERCHVKYIARVLFLQKACCFGRTNVSLLLISTIRFTFAENIRNQVARVEFRRSTIKHVDQLRLATHHLVHTVVLYYPGCMHARGVLPEPVTTVGPLSYLFLQKHSTLTKMLTADPIMQYRSKPDYYWIIGDTGTKQAAGDLNFARSAFSDACMDLAVADKPKTVN
jgi:hypothetical protein